MTDLATWITGGAAAVAAIASAIFAWLANQSQQAAMAAQQRATEAAGQAAEAADRAQRIQVRPALRIDWDQRAAEDVFNVPILLTLYVRNVGHGTAIIERVMLFERGNPRLDFGDTRNIEQELAEQLDVEIFQRLEGVPIAAIPGGLRISPLTDNDRALEVGVTRELFVLSIAPAHAARISNNFRNHVLAIVRYRSLTGEVFDTDRQFADVRNAEQR